ncbi:hypothetical protein BC830DRAFT_791222 [Chytriomyces sp. MP71]|nr:hypothetical protein BC830DRAFT_791222 [Chytriomyces sp. MP71]
MNATGTNEDSANTQIYDSIAYALLSMGVLAAMQVVAVIGFIIWNEEPWLTYFNIQLIAMGFSMVGNFVFNGLLYLPAWSSGGTEPLTVFLWVNAAIFTNVPVITYMIFSYQRSLVILTSRQTLIRRTLWFIVSLQVVFDLVATAAELIEYCLFDVSTEAHELLSLINTYGYTASYAILTAFDACLLFLFQARVRKTRMQGESASMKLELICRYGMASSLLCTASTVLYLAYSVGPTTPEIEWCFFGSIFVLYAVWSTQVGLKVSLMRENAAKRESSLRPGTLERKGFLSSIKDGAGVLL